jgi:hypothetical protein
MILSKQKESLWRKLVRGHTCTFRTYTRKMACKDRRSSTGSRPCPSTSSCERDGSSISAKHRMICGDRDPWLSLDDEWTWIDWIGGKNAENDISTEEYVDMRLRAECAAAFQVAADTAPASTQSFAGNKNPSITHDHRINQDRSDSELHMSPPNDSAASFTCTVEINPSTLPTPLKSPVQRRRRLWGRLFGCFRSAANDFEINARTATCA